MPVCGFPACLQPCHPPGRGKMVLVLGRVSISKGPNIPGASCSSRSQVIAQIQMDGLGIRHHRLSGVTSHLWLVVVVTEQIDIYGIVFLSPSLSFSLSFFLIVRWGHYEISPIMSHWAWDMFLFVVAFCYCYQSV